MPPGCQPGRHRFVSRNRVIAAISQATIVVEAAWRSGALSTAHRALELGRQLGAVPGPVTSMSSVGCHRLLRKGAVCITDTDDALELLTPLGTVDADAVKEQDPALTGGGLLDGLDPDASLVLDAMPPGPRRAPSPSSAPRGCPRRRQDRHWGSSSSRGRWSAPPLVGEDAVSTRRHTFGIALRSACSCLFGHSVPWGLCDRGSRQRQHLRRTRALVQQLKPLNESTYRILSICGLWCWWQVASPRWIREPAA